nr:MAG TPA: hypothetical protein [Caudoviricetes sp.]
MGLYSERLVNKINKALLKLAYLIRFYYLCSGQD